MTTDEIKCVECCGSGVLSGVQNDVLNYQQCYRCNGAGFYIAPSAPLVAVGDNSQIESLKARLRIHAADSNNTAFARSTMREFLEVFASPSVQATVEPLTDEQIIALCKPVVGSFDEKSIYAVAVEERGETTIDITDDIVDCVRICLLAATPPASKATEHKICSHNWNCPVHGDYPCIEALNATNNAATGSYNEGLEAAAIIFNERARGHSIHHRHTEMYEADRCARDIRSLKSATPSTIKEEPTAASQEPDDTDCEKCGQHWADHDFGVPEPTCPSIIKGDQL